MDNKKVKLIGVVATLTGAAVSLVANWAGEKQQDAKIEEKVAEALAKAGKES